MLQTRTGKRTAQAALKIAVDCAESGVISRAEAVQRIDPASLDQLLHPRLDPKAKKDILAKGLPASPGAASGMVVFSADEAEARTAHGERGDPGADRDQPRGYSRHARGQGHADDARRHDQPCGRGGARHGPALRRRRRRSAHRLCRRDHDGPRPHRARRRRHHHRRLDGRSHARRGADAPARTLGRFRHRHGLGRRGAPACACAPMPTHRPTRAPRAASAPKASACAAPSTCSSRATASSRCAR